MISKQGEAIRDNRSPEARRWAGRAAPSLYYTENALWMYTWFLGRKTSFHQTLEQSGPATVKPSNPETERDEITPV